MVAVERAPWQNTRVLTTLALVFIAGAATGALSMQFGLHERLHHAVAPSVSREEVLQRFKSELNLTADQAEKIRLVLDDYRQYYESVQDQLDDMRATGKSRIVQILNPEQRVKFEKMMNDIEPALPSAPAR